MEGLERRLGLSSMDETSCSANRRVCMGEIMPTLRDPGVRHLAECIYRRVCSVSPDDVYAMIRDENWTALGNALSSGDGVERTAECDDHRVLECGLHDLCPDAIQRHWSDPAETSPRWFTAVYTFGDPRTARLATAVNARIFQGANATLGILSDALDTYRIGTLHETHDADWHLPVSAWIRTREATIDVVGRLVSLVAVSRRHRSAFTCLVASHEWIAPHADPLVLRHRGVLDVTLRYVRQVVGGVVEVDVEDSDDAWPPFLLENRMVPPAMFPALTSSSPCIVDRPHSSSDAPARKRAIIDVDTLSSDRYVRTVIRAWHKSYTSGYADAPTLLSLATDVPLVETLTHGDLVAKRVHAITSRHGQDARGLLLERFGTEYADDAMRRLLNDAVAGLYAVYTRDDDACVSTFGVLLFHARHAHADILACCIDSFAVSLAHQGGGIGGATFHALLRGVCARASRGAGDDPYHVFAQCVRTGDARHFWYDKLDESTVARSLLLQAFHIDPARVPVQMTGQCGPRSREYRSCDLRESRDLE